MAPKRAQGDKGHDPSRVFQMSQHPQASIGVVAAFVEATLIGGDFEGPFSV
jgi:hypothetical protein